MKRSHLALGVAVLALAVLVYLFHGRIHFDIHSFAAEIRHVSIRHIATGVGLIYACFWLRAMRTFGAGFEPVGQIVERNLV